MSAQGTESSELQVKPAESMHEVCVCDFASLAFAGHHWTGLEAVIAGTLKPSDDISACAVAAGIANVTLISV